MNEKSDLAADLLKTYSNTKQKRTCLCYLDEYTTGTIGISGLWKHALCEQQWRNMRISDNTKKKSSHCEKGKKKKIKIPTPQFARGEASLQKSFSDN